MIKKTTKTYSKTYRFYIFVKTSLQFFAFFLFKPKYRKFFFRILEISSNNFTKAWGNLIF